jgi:hypothetical protein
MVGSKYEGRKLHSTIQSSLIESFASFQLIDVSIIQSIETFGGAFIL